MVNYAVKTLGSLDNVTVMILYIEGLELEIEGGDDDDDEEEEISRSVSKAKLERNDRNVSAPASDSVTTVFKGVAKAVTSIGRSNTDDDDLMDFLNDDSNF